MTATEEILSGADRAAIAAVAAQPVRPVIDPEFIALNLERCQRWHPGGIHDWTLAEWHECVTGELGEACNAAKKARRIRDDIANVSADPDRQIDDPAAAVAEILIEHADTFIYLTLAAISASDDPDALNRAIAQKFNAVSERYGFPERWE